MTRKVLIIDDEHIIQRMIGIVLMRRGFDVHTASSATEALAFLQRENVDLITLDLMLPEMDGIEFLGLLRSEPRWADIKVIMISAAIFSQELAQTMQAGAQAVLNKPFSLRELDDVLDSLFGA